MTAALSWESPLGKGTLIRRYKRFLADVQLEDGSVITIHCPNTGSMKNCGCPGDEVWFSTSGNKKRKYAHTWELVRTRAGHYIGINTSRANRLVEVALRNDLVPELAGYASLTREVGYGAEGSRIDFLLRGHERLPDCFVEVKSVTLLEAPVSRGRGCFPDAVSERGTRHLRELIKVASGDARAVLLYCVQHSGIQEVRPADHIDPVYGETLREASAMGVEIVAWKTRMSRHGCGLWRPVPVKLEGP